MVDVLREINIARSQSLVSAYASDQDNAPEWYDNINSASWLTPRPLIQGSKIKFQARFMGKQLEYTYEITALKSGVMLVMSTFEGPFPMETIYTWRELDKDSCQMTLRNRGNPKGFSKLVAPLMAMMMKKAMQKDLIKLKNILENQ